MLPAIASIGLTIATSAMSANAQSKNNIQNAESSGKSVAQTTFNARRQRDALLETIPTIRSNIENAIQASDAASEIMKAQKTVEAVTSGVAGSSVERTLGLIDYENEVNKANTREEGFNMFDNVGQSILDLNLEEARNTGTTNVQKRDSMVDLANIGASLLNNWDGLFDE